MNRAVYHGISKSSHSNESTQLKLSEHEKFSESCQNSQSSDCKLFLGIRGHKSLLLRYTSILLRKMVLHENDEDIGAQSKT